MFKNVASQKWVVFAFEGEGGSNPGNPVTGDAANITANLRLDGGAANAVDDTNPTELEDGYYIFDITAAESNADMILMAPASGTANVIVIGVPGALYPTNDIGLAGAALGDLGGMSTAMKAEVNVEVDTAVDALNDFDPANDDVAVVTALTNLPSIPANWITSAGITDGSFIASKFAAGFITASKFAAGAIDAVALATTAVEEIRDSIWNAILTGATFNIATSAGKRLRQIDAAFEVHSGMADAGSTSTTINLETGVADAVTDDIYAGDRCVIVAGTGVGEHGLIKSYDASTQIATMSKAWNITPDDTSEYILTPADVDVELWNDNTVTGDGDWAELQTDVDDVLTDTADMQPKLGTPATDVSADIAAVKVDTAATLVDTAVIGVAGAGLTDLGGMSTGMKAEVNTEVDGALDTAIPELSGVPSATPTLREAIMFLFMGVRNKRDTTSTSDEIHNDAGSVIATATLSDDTVTYISGEYS